MSTLPVAGEREVILRAAVRRFKTLSFRRKPAPDCEYSVLS